MAPGSPTTGRSQPVGAVSVTRSSLGTVEERRFPSEPEAATASRRVLDELLGGDLDDATLENARLLTTELVTNAVRHGPKGRYADVRLRVRVRDSVVRIEVIDDGPGFVRPERGPREIGGWGLLLVESVSDRWGIEKGGPTTVWFELDRPPEPAGAVRVRSSWPPALDSTLLEVQHAGLIAADLHGTITRWNRDAARLFAFEATEVIGRPITEVLVPAERPDAADRLLRWLREQATVDEEWLAPRRGGGRVWVRLSIAPVRDERGEAIGTVLVAMDIGERRRAQAALAESEERLRIALDAGRMGTWDWDMRTGTVRWSESLERIHGLEPGSFGGMFEHFQADIHPEDRSTVLDTMQRAMQEGREWALDYRIVRPDGDIRWLAVRARVLRDSERAVGMAGVCADITGRKEAERSLALQYAVSRVLSTATSAEDATPTLLQAIAQALGLEMGVLWRLDQDADVLRFVGGWNAPTIGAHFLHKSREFLFERDVGLPGRVWSSARAAWVADVTVEENFPRGPFAAAEGLRSAFAFPITLHDEVLGVVEFYSRRIRQPEQELLDLTSALGAQIGQFLERSSAETELVESEARKSAIFESALEAIVTMDQHGVIVEMNAAAADMFGVEREEAIGRELASVMIPPRYRERHREALARYGRTGSGRILGRRLELHGARADGTEFPVELTVTRVELPDPAEILFTGYVRDLTPRRRAEELQARLFESERAAREQIERARDREAFLSEAGVLLASSLDSRRTLAKIARLVVPRLADWCSVDLVEPDGSIAVVAATHADPGMIERARAHRRRSARRLDDGSRVSAVIAAGAPELLPEIAPETLERDVPDPEWRTLAAELGFRSAMIVPLVARGRAVGAVTFATAGSDRRFGEEDLELGKELARRAALAIDNSRLYEERSHIARTLQRTLLPRRLPQIPRLQVAAFYQPAGTMQTEVGGDFFDVFEAGERAWGVVIGDVCGKGVEAAALTGMARHSVRGSAAREPSPSAALEDLNRIMLREDGERFCTVALGRIERIDAGVVLTVACGGHPQPLVVRRDGRVESVGVPGSLLGVFEHVEIEDRVVGLAPGDQAVFFTDGLVDARHPSGLDESGLRELAASCAGATAQETADRFAEVIAEKSEEAPDDICVVTISVDA